MRKGEAAPPGWVSPFFFRLLTCHDSEQQGRGELAPGEGIPNPLSCAGLVEAGAQRLLINDAMATAAAGYACRLLHRMPPESFTSFVSLEAAWPVPVSAEEIGAYLRV